MRPSIPDLLADIGVAGGGTPTPEQVWGGDLPRFRGWSPTLGHTDPVEKLQKLEMDCGEVVANLEGGTR